MEKADYIQILMRQLNDISESKKNHCPYSLAIYINLQKLEWREHKWYLSEILNKSVTYGEVIADWIMTKHSEIGNITHAERFHNDYLRHVSQIEEACRDNCGEECRGMENCLFAASEKHEKLHNLMED